MVLTDVVRVLWQATAVPSSWCWALALNLLVEVSDCASRLSPLGAAQSQCSQDVLQNAQVPLLNLTLPRTSIYFLFLSSWVIRAKVIFMWLDTVKWPISRASRVWMVYVRPTWWCFFFYWIDCYNFQRHASVITWSFTVRCWSVCMWAPGTTQ